MAQGRCYNFDTMTAPPLDHSLTPVLQWQERLSAWLQSGGRGDTFEALALELHAFQKSRCPVIAAYAAVTAGPTEPGHWKEIPALPVEAYKRTRVTIFPEEATQHEFITSGTTGEERGRHFMPNVDLYQTAVCQGWSEAGLPDFPQLLLLPGETQAPQSSLATMFRLLRRGLGIHQTGFWQPGYQLDSDAIRSSVSAAAGPLCVAGTALAFLHLLESAAPIRLPAGSILLETGGFKGSARTIQKAVLYQQLQEFFGVEETAIWNEYGMTELSSQFYTQGLGKVHQGGFWVRGMVVDPATGQEAADGATGLLRLYDLANLFSCMAVETQDLAVRRGDSFELIGRDPAALPRGCSREADAVLQAAG